MVYAFVIEDLASDVQGIGEKDRGATEAGAPRLMLLVCASRVAELCRSGKTRVTNKPRLDYDETRDGFIKGLPDKKQIVTEFHKKLPLYYCNFE